MNAGDYEALAKAVCTMSELNDSRLKAYGENGKSFYEANFRKEQRIEQLQELLI